MSVLRKCFTPALVSLAAIAAAATIGLGPVAAEGAHLVPPPHVDATAGKGIQTAVLAGGCFWGLEGVFEHVKGVRSVVSGYAGGSSTDATYDKVSSETTNHAEAVRISYDPSQVSYGTLLRIYFSVTTDPTELDRQGPDSGRSYRSAIFPQNGEQEKIARAYIGELSQAKVFPRPIVTRIEHGAFFPAEAYHQHFMQRHPSHPYIVINDAPKVAALKHLFPQLYHA